MPIHTSWKSMAKGMRKQYPGKVCRDFTDGSKVCMGEKGWSIFYATGTKRYGKGFETKKMPKKTEESLKAIVQWYLEERKSVRNGV